MEGQPASIFRIGNFKASMSPHGPTGSCPGALVAVKVVHTVAWAFFAGCILAIPVASWQGNYAAAAWLTAIVFVEIAVLVVNGWHCPLTLLAYRFTDSRRANFDIYLPEWLAKHNKLIFGTLFCLGMAFALCRWLLASS